MASPVKKPFEPEASEAIGSCATSRCTALLASMRVGLTQEQFERLMRAIEGRGGLLSDLHKLTTEQQAVVDAFRKLGAGDGHPRSRGQPCRESVRDGPRGGGGPARAAPDGRASSSSRRVVTVDVERGAGRIWLPDCICDTDRIARIEFLDERGAVLGVTGGEKPREQEEGSGPCSTY